MYVFKIPSFVKSKHFKKLVKNVEGKRIKMLRMGWGVEYMVREFIKIFQELGIYIKTSCFCTQPHQNSEQKKK
jgi:hypothetical protein